MNDHTHRQMAAWQSGLSLMVLASVCATCVLIDTLCQSSWIEAKLIAWDVARFRDDVEHCMNRGGFLDYEDRVILDSLPNADYSHGGVYFFGSSPMKWATASWEMPGELQSVIHNYGIGATSHELQADFIRFLILHQGFARAGEHTHVILGLYWSMGLSWNPSSFFKPLWERHGLYTYSAERGIEPVSMNGASRFLLERRARCASFIGGNMKRIARWATTALGMRIGGPTDNIGDPDLVRAYIQRAAGGTRWETSLPEQMTALENLIELLRAHDLDVTAVLLPTREGFWDYPFPVAYREQSRELCRRKSVPFVDLSGLVSEARFWDINHVDYLGLQLTHAVLMDIALECLRRSGDAPAMGPPPIPGT